MSGKEPKLSVGGGAVPIVTAGVRSPVKTTQCSSSLDRHSSVGGDSVLPVRVEPRDDHRGSLVQSDGSKARDSSGHRNKVAEKGKRPDAVKTHVPHKDSHNTKTGKTAFHFNSNASNERTMYKTPSATGQRRRQYGKGGPKKPLLKRDDATPLTSNRRVQTLPTSLSSYNMEDSSFRFGDSSVNPSLKRPWGLDGGSDTSSSSSSHGGSQSSNCLKDAEKKKKRKRKKKKKVAVSEVLVDKGTDITTMP